jgi:cell division protein FtsI (penicillin-binding protein 3)
MKLGAKNSAKKPAPKVAIKRKKKAPRVQRSGVMALVLALVLLGVVARAFVLQVQRNEPLKKMAEEQYLKEIEIPARRGAIFDRSGNALAVSNIVSSVFAHPHHVANLRAEAAILAKKLALPIAELQQKLASDRLFVWLKRRIDPRLAEDVGKLGLASVGVVPETRRYYPNRTLFSHVLGAVDVDGKGIEGIESTLEDELAGVPASAAGLRDAHGRTVLFDDVGGAPGIQGNDLYLTVDRDIQQLATAALAEGIERVHAKAGSVVVLDPRSGDVLALANYPEYNPNVFDKVPMAVRRNRAVNDLFEPGSTFKSILMSAALQEGVVRIGDQIFCENGHYRIGGETIHDAHPLGLITAKSVIAASSNIGAAKIGMQLGRERFAHYIQAFGFGQKTGVELPGEAFGLVRPAKKWPLIQLATVSYGQGISVSTMQLAQAYAAIANDGVMMRPRLLNMIQTPDGQKRMMPRPAGVRVIAHDTAQTLNQMLEAVVSDKGTGTRAEIPGIEVAGKTATAQKVDPATSTYSQDKFVANFAGYVPANDPRLVIVVMVDEPPRPNHFGGIAAAPIFQKIALGSLQLLGLMPATQVAAAAPTAAVPDETDDLAEAEELTPGVMPDLRGLMLGEAFDMLKRSGVTFEPEVRGSGRIVAQEPAPGTKTKSNGKLHLQLASAAQRSEHNASR